ncbi:MAG TPA: hypothetical protein VGR74_05325, partial [Actinomycetota bacterium]|nr:hypothetical protein [Actinomycetota bacterium]
MSPKPWWPASTSTSVGSNPRPSSSTRRVTVGPDRSSRTRTCRGGGVLLDVGQCLLGDPEQGGLT